MSYDGGSAPNPFWGICTLAICKPAIRRVAQVGDWIVATGSKEFGFENQVVYAMKVTDKMTLKEYDSHCKKHLPNKIPVWKTTNLKLRAGDCIYDYSKGDPILRPSVHKQENMKTDLGGENVLLSNHFYYFGSKLVPLPTDLIRIVKQSQGHKSKSNEPFKEKFVEWIESFARICNRIEAMPYGLKDFEDEECIIKCSKKHVEEDEADEKEDSPDSE